MEQEVEGSPGNLSVSSNWLNQTFGFLISQLQLLYETKVRIVKSENMDGDRGKGGKGRKKKPEMELSKPKYIRIGEFQV